MTQEWHAILKTNSDWMNLLRSFIVEMPRRDSFISCSLVFTLLYTWSQVAKQYDTLQPVLKPRGINLQPSNNSGFWQAPRQHSCPGPFQF